MTTILIADDVDENRYFLISLLEGSGFEVVSVKNGADALSQAEASPPDLIVSDLMMPVMDGFELLRRWKAHEGLRHVPFIVYTATYTDPKDERLAVSLGADRFLIKPQDIDALLQVVNEVLEEAGGEDADSPAGPSGDEMELLRLHNEALFRKIEKKMRQLEAEIARRDEVESALRRTSAFLDSIVENIPDMVFLKDAGELRFVRFNRAGEKLLGYPREDLLGKNDHDLFPREQADAFTRKDREVLRGGVVVEIPEESLSTRDMGERILRTRKVPLLNAEGEPEYLLGVSQDVTERRKADEERRELQGQLLASQRLEAIGRLAGGVAHDFNNLLSVILIYSGFALEATREGDPLRGDIEVIRSAGERAAALTRQLLAFSRKQVLTPEILDLNQVVGDIESMLRRLLGEDIDIQIRLAGELDSVLADPGQIEQVLMNLALNARDAMQQGGRLTIETENVELDESYAHQHSEVQPGRYVRLSVSDSGCGMDAAIREHIFEPFFTTKKGKGTGLGLSIVHGIVKQSGGDIWVYSEPGRGTTFKVYLPRVEGAPPEVTRRPTSVSATRAERVLIVEDENAVRIAAERILRGAGYRVQAVPNGGEALLYCEKDGNEIDLLLTDVIMPGMSGPELARRLAKLTPGLRTIYMSGYAEEEALQELGTDPRTGFIGKPFSIAELTRKVREVLDTG